MHESHEPVFEMIDTSSRREAAVPRVRNVRQDNKVPYCDSVLPQDPTLMYAGKQRIACFKCGWVVAFKYRNEHLDSPICLRRSAERRQQ